MDQVGLARMVIAHLEIRPSGIRPRVSKPTPPSPPRSLRSLAGGFQEIWNAPCGISVLRAMQGYFCEMKWDVAISQNKDDFMWLKFKLLKMMAVTELTWQLMNVHGCYGEYVATFQ